MCKHAHMTKLYGYKYVYIFNWKSVEAESRITVITEHCIDKRMMMNFGTPRFLCIVHYCHIFCLSLS